MTARADLSARAGRERAGGHGARPGGALAGLAALAVIHARAGELPPDAAEVICEAGGCALITGDGAEPAAAGAAASRVWWCDTGPGLQPGRLAGRLAAAVAGIPLLVLPGIGGRA